MIGSSKIKGAGEEAAVTCFKFPEVPQLTTDNLSRHFWGHGQDSKHAPSEFKSEVTGLAA
jgi:hypothetical protein